MGKKTATFLEGRLLEDYGVTLPETNPTTVIWAAESVGRDFGWPTALDELRVVNRARERAGKSPAYPVHGTPLFEEQCRRRTWS